MQTTDGTWLLRRQEQGYADLRVQTPSPLRAYVRAQMFDDGLSIEEIHLDGDAVIAVRCEIDMASADSMLSDGTHPLTVTAHRHHADRLIQQCGLVEYQGS